MVNAAVNYIDHVTLCIDLIFLSPEPLVTIGIENIDFSSIGTDDLVV